MLTVELHQVSESISPRPRHIADTSSTSRESQRRASLTSCGSTVQTHRTQRLPLPSVLLTQPPLGLLSDGCLRNVIRVMERDTGRYAIREGTEFDMAHQIDRKLVRESRVRNRISTIFIRQGQE